MTDIAKVFLLPLMDPIILIPIIMTSIVSSSVIATIVVGLLSAYLSAQFLTSEASTVETYVAYLACGVILALICSFAATKVREQLRRSNGRITFMRWQLALDNRVSIVVLALLLAYLIAAIAAHALSSTLNKESGAIWANVYASWVVDVTFFTLVGLAVSLMGFREPLNK